MALVLSSPFLAPAEEAPAWKLAVAALASRLLPRFSFKGALGSLRSDPRRQQGSAKLRAWHLRFGRPFRLPPGPVTLARAAGVPLEPVFSFRGGRLESRVIFRPPIRVAHSEDRQKDVHEALQAMAREVEWAIRKDPYQWFCFRELWPQESAV